MGYCREQLSEVKTFLFNGVIYSLRKLGQGDRLNRFSVELILDNGVLPFVYPLRCKRA